jgi:hypothetical protein
MPNFGTALPYLNSRSVEREGTHTLLREQLCGTLASLSGNSLSEEVLKRELLLLLSEFVFATVVKNPSTRSEINHFRRLIFSFNYII